MILREGVTPDEWADLCNVQTYDRNAVRKDAAEFWAWLFEGEPLPQPDP